MAFRAIMTVGGGGLQAEGSFAASQTGWKFYSAETINNFWLRLAWNNSSPIGTFRQNNDGPGFTGNRTTTVPDLYRPIPFKDIPVAVITKIEPRRLIRRMTHQSSRSPS